MIARSCRYEGGFTLLETLTAFTVVSILAVLAVPAYLDYKVRAKISEGLVRARSAMVAMTHHYELNGEWPTTNIEAGLPPPINFRSNYVESISVGGNSPEPQIFLVYNLPELGAENTLIFFAEVIPGTAAIRWHCTRGNILDKFRPPECRA